MAESKDRRSQLALVYMVLLGLAGGIMLAASYWNADLVPRPAADPDWMTLTTFFVVIVASRAMASPLYGQSVLSLDAGFYLAAAVCLGSAVSGRLLALAMFVDALYRGPSKRIRRQTHRGWLSRAAYALYFGGMSGGLLLVVSWVGGLDELYSLQGLSDLRVIVHVLAVGSIFLALHYGIQGGRLVIEGANPRALVKKLIVPGLIAESAVLPLAVILIFLYHPDQPLRFVLMGSMYLVANYAYNRMSNTRHQLRRRVKELETLGSTSRRLAASLQIHELVKSVAEEVQRAIPAADWVLLGHCHAVAGGRVVVERYLCSEGEFDRRVDEQGDELFELLSEGRGFSSTQLELLAGRLGTGELGSLLVVPVEIEGKTAGFVAVAARAERAFSSESRRLLRAMVSQVAVALQNVQLYELAMVDGLTGLYVRRYFDARLAEEFERSARFDTEFAVVMIDLDDFKKLNDSYGHQVGDAALKAVSRVIHREMRGVDTAARYGGEEISLVLPRTGMVQAYALAERIRGAIGDIELDDGKGGSLSLSASMGIASHPESQADGPDALVRLADNALYRAKKTGKNRVELYWSATSEEERIPQAL